MEKNDSFFGNYSHFLDSTGQHVTYAALHTYLNSGNELSEKEKRFFATHLDSCTACSMRLKEVEEVENAAETAHSQWWASPAAFRYAIAASLVLILGASVVLYVTLNRPAPASSPARSLATNTVDPRRFVPNAMLENFVARTVRSSSGARFSAPRMGDTLSVPFTLRWFPQEGKHVYALSIVDNKNNEVWRGATGDAEITVEKQLEPGLYYVKLEADAKLADVGKFVILH